LGKELRQYTEEGERGRDKEEVRKGKKWNKKGGLGPGNKWCLGHRNQKKKSQRCKKFWFHQTRRVKGKK